MTTVSEGRSASQAILVYLALQEWQIAAIQEGVTAADLEELVEHDEVLKILQGWGTKRDAA